MLNIDIYAGSEAKVIIGKFCSISKNVRIITGGIHPTNWISTYPFRRKFNLPSQEEDGMPSTKGDVIIGNDLWLGTGSTILSGVRIGNGSIVAAGSVVSKNVPDYALIGGVPARIIRYRFTEEQIFALLKIQWWNWDLSKVINNVNLLSSPNIQEFIDKHNILNN